MDAQHGKKGGLVTISYTDVYVHLFHEKGENKLEKKRTRKRNLNMRNDKEKN